MDQFYIATFSVSLMVISIICYMKAFQKAPPLPPGPFGLPIVGYLPFLGNNLLHQFAELGHKYGPVFKLYLGNKLCVVISSPSLVKQVVRNQDAIFANRDVPIAAFIASYGGNDIVWSPPNSKWRAMRKLFVQEMMSNASLEASSLLRKEEVKRAIRRVHDEIGKPVELGNLIYRSELNVTLNMLWGGTTAGEEGERIAAEFQVVVSKVIDLFGKPNISDFFPVLAHLDIQGIKKQTERHVQSVERILDVVIAEQKKKLSTEIKKEGNKDFLRILLELQQKEDSDINQ